MRGIPSHRRARAAKQVCQSFARREFDDYMSEYVERSILGTHSLHDYEPLIGAEAVRRILTKADALRGSKIAHISSTFYGGGVAEILTPLTLLMNAIGIETAWHLIQGTPA